MSHVTEIAGDLFALSVVYPDAALAHGCNLKGAMGAGIAVEFKRRWHDMYLRYREQCLSRTPPALGGVMIYEASDGRVIYNGYTQPVPGRTATYEAVRSVMRIIRMSMDQRGIKRLIIPRIGCGLGGLEWTRVREEVEGAFWNSDIAVLVATGLPVEQRP